MASGTNSLPRGRPPGGGLMPLLRPYKGLIAALTILTVAGNALNLVVPQLIAHAIDAYTQGTFSISAVVPRFLAVAILVFLFAYFQSIAQTYASEGVARDLRSRLAAKIAKQSYSYVEQVTPAKLLTNLTADVDGVKMFVSQGVASVISALFLIIGASILLLAINWKLGLAVLGVIPAVGGAFYFALKKVRALFQKSQESIDALNRVINESILGATLIRILNSQHVESQKFNVANTVSKDIGLDILRIMSGMIPAITLATNLATTVILLLGGRFVIQGSMTLGDFTAFNSYLAILIFPIIMLGFTSNIMAQATASYMRLGAVLMAPDAKDPGHLRSALQGAIEVRGVSLSFGDKQTLKNVSFAVAPGSSNAIIGPTAAGKTQMLNVLIGLLAPNAGTVIYDGEPLDLYEKETLHRQIGLVFQDSILFNMSLRENIAFSASIPQEEFDRAIAAAELEGLIRSLPQGLDTIVSERGTTLSGGQKQRVMLARALALNPKVLLLDDFTARVDAATERSIRDNLRKLYPGITLVSVTQKIASVEDYDQIIVLMEGEVLASGTHKRLMETSPEYVQIYDSQRSTNVYEAQA